MSQKKFLFIVWIWKLISFSNHVFTALNLSKIKSYESVKVSLALKNCFLKSTFFYVWVFFVFIFKLLFLTWNVCLNCLFVLRINVLRDASKVNTHFSTVAIEKICTYIWKEVSEKRKPKTSPFFRCTSVQYKLFLAYGIPATNSATMNPEFLDQICCFF